MPDLRISELQPATSLSGDELIEVVQDGQNKRALVSQIPGGGGGSDRRTVTAVTSSSGTVTLDYSLGDYFTIELSEDVGGVIISNPPASGIGGTIGVRITQDSTPRTVAFGADIQFTASSPLDAVPTDAGSDTLLIMTSFDGGAVWMATMDTLA